jgi:hypothetical protein
MKDNFHKITLQIKHPKHESGYRERRLRAAVQCIAPIYQAATVYQDRSIAFKPAADLKI